MRRGRGDDVASTAWSCDEAEGDFVGDGSTHIIIGRDVASAPAQSAVIFDATATAGLNQQHHRRPNKQSPSLVASLSGCFDKVRVLRRGSQGVVYLARCRATHRLVAVKRMFCDARELSMRGVADSVLREIGLLSRLSADCAHLIRFVQVAATRAGELCLVMEACQGDVTAYLQAAGPPPMEFVAHVMRGVLGALQHLHRHSVLHRDIKPSNVLLREDGSIALADLGSAREVFDDGVGGGASSGGGGGGSAPLTPGARRTTLPYRAPEVLLGDRHYTAAVDMWGVGVLLAELLRGSHLFSASSEMQTLTRVFAFIGTPTEETWPEFHNFPLLQAFNFAVLAPTLAASVAAWRPALPRHGGASAATAIDLLERLMSPNPAQRPTAEQCLCHAFFDEFPSSAAAWVRWRAEGDGVPARKPVSISMALSLGGGDDEDEDD